MRNQFLKNKKVFFKYFSENKALRIYQYIRRTHRLNMKDEGIIYSSRSFTINVYKIVLSLIMSSQRNRFSQRELLFINSLKKKKKHEYYRYPFIKKKIKKFFKLKTAKHKDILFRHKFFKSLVIKSKFFKKRIKQLTKQVKFIHFKIKKIRIKKKFNFKKWWIFSSKLLFLTRFAKKRKYIKKNIMLRFLYNYRIDCG